MHARIAFPRQPYCVVERARECGRDIAWPRRVGQWLSDGLEEADLGRFQLLGRLLHARLGGEQPFLGLLPVGLIQRAARDALPDVAENCLVEAEIFLRFGNDRSLQHVLQIVLDNGQPDEFGPFQHTE